MERIAITRMQPKRARIFCLVLAMIFFNLPDHGLLAQKDHRLPAAKLITSIPFKTFSGGIIVIKLNLNNNPDSLNFIFDTGSGDISLDSATCLQMKMQPVTSDHTVIGIAGVRQAKKIYKQVIHLPNLSTDSLTFNVTDYEILSSVYGERINGILGNVFLSHYIVRLDYDSMKLYIYSKGYIKYPRGGFMLRPAMTDLPIHYTTLRDNSDINSRFYFDTGAGLCMLLTSNFVSDSSLLNPKRKPLITQAQGMGGKIEVQLTYLKEVQLGPYRFHKVPTYIFQDDHNITSYPSISGLMGNDLLRRFNVILNFSQKEIYLVPNTHYRDPFDYSYTGMSIYWIDGTIRVGDVIKDSPAEKAGFKPGDIILAVDNNFTGNFQTYITLLQNIGVKIKVIVKRENHIAQLTLKVKSIL